MKRKISTIIFVIVVTIVCCVVGIFACGHITDGNSGNDSGDGGNDNKPIANAVVSGTYYYYENGEYDAAMFIKFGSTKWSDDEALNGDYKISGNSIVLYIGIEDENIVFLNGTVNNDEVKFKVLDGYYVYKKNADLDILPAQKTLSLKLNDEKTSYIVTGIGGMSGDIIVPESYKKKPVVGISDNAFANKDSLTSIKLPDTLTYIGASAFDSCVNLSSIELPSSVTKLGEKAFNKCENLTSAKINGSIDEIKEKAFADCAKLEEITLPSTLKSIGKRAFINCLSLTDVYYLGSVKDWCSIDFGEVDKSELGWANPLSSNDDYDDKEYADRKLIIDEKIVTDIEITYPVSTGAFIFYAGLKSVKIDAGMPSVEDYTFCGCENIETLTIVDNSIKTIGIDAFQNTKKLKSLVIPDCITDIGGDAFSGSGVESVVIGNGVTNIESRAFLWCENLTSLTIGNSVAEIEEYAFSQCGLTAVTIPQSVLYIGAYAFQGTPLTTVTFERTEGWITGGKENITGGQGEVPSSDMANPTKVAKYLTTSTIHGGLMSVHIEVNPSINPSINLLIFTIIPGTSSYSVTADTTKISSRKEIIIPSTWNGFPVTEVGEHAFYNCSSLTSIEIPNSVMRIGVAAFYGCSSLTSIEIPNSVMSIGNYAFYNCSSLTSMEIPNGVTSIQYYAFCNCSSLTSIDIPNSVTSIGNYAFRGCSGLTSIDIPNSVTSIGAWAFLGCSSLMSITISNSVTSIGDYAFRNCSSLTSIDIPNGVTSIGEGAFDGCSSLTSIDIPNGVTSIKNFAFDGCSSLTSVTIPNSVASIGGNAFYGCSSLTSIVFNGTIAKWKVINKYSSWNSNTGNYIVSCTDGVLSKSES